MAFAVLLFLCLHLEAHMQLAVVVHLMRNVGLHYLWVRGNCRKTKLATIHAHLGPVITDVLCGSFISEHVRIIPAIIRVKTLNQKWRIIPIIA